MLGKHRKYQCFGLILGLGGWENIVKSVVLLLVRAEDPVNYGVLDVFWHHVFPLNRKKNIVKYMCFSCSPSLCNIKSSAPIKSFTMEKSKEKGRPFFEKIRQPFFSQLQVTVGDASIPIFSLAASPVLRSLSMYIYIYIDLNTQGKRFCLSEWIVARCKIRG